MADEEHELPILVVAPAPAWHAGEANAVLDDREQFAVREVLSGAGPEVWSGRVETLVDRRLAAAVIGVAQGAVVREMVSCLGQDQWGRAHGVLKPRHCSWNGKAPQMTGNERLDGRWLVAGAAP